MTYLVGYDEDPGDYHDSQCMAVATGDETDCDLDC